MSNYARANTSHWYQDNFPGSTMDPNAVVIHTTEGASLPDYSGGAVAPNYTAVPNFKLKRLDWFAHFPDEKSSRALVNKSGGVETNTLNVVQVELVGTCAPATHAEWTRKGIAHIYWPEAPDWALEDFARFVVDMNKRHKIRIAGAKDWRAYPDSYGSGGQRFSQAQWQNFYGYCGHQHVPENVHGDPGNFPWAKVEAFAKALLGITKPVVPVGPQGSSKAPVRRRPARTPNITAALEAKTRALRLVALHQVATHGNAKAARVARAYIAAIGELNQAEAAVSAQNKALRALEVK